MLHQLFSVRTLGLFNELPPEKLASYLSGLLIGIEVAGAIDGRSICAQGAAITHGATAIECVVESICDPEFGV